jgi:hypothetical protein
MQISAIVFRQSFGRSTLASLPAGIFGVEMVQTNIAPADFAGAGDLVSFFRRF